MTTRNIGIVGAGLAGLLLARRLTEAGADPADIALIDAGRPERASSVPGAIFHPFPGRSIAPRADRLRQARETVDTIEEWRQHLGASAILPAPIARPLTDDEQGRRLRDSYAGPDAYPEWLEIETMAGDELRRLEPRLDAVDEAIVYRPAYCLDLNAVTDWLADDLRDRGVDLRTDTPVASLERYDGGWQLAGPSGQRLATVETVVTAVGSALDTWFPDLAMRGRGGELLVTRRSADPALACIINAGGHVAPHPAGGVAVGSTWFDSEEFDERTDARARAELVDRCADLYPELRDEPAGEIWRGVRANFGDHQPLVGPIPGLDGVWAFGAFGSTGLMRIPLHARLTAGALVGDETEIPELSRADRMNRDKWRPSPDIVSVT